MSTNGAKLPVQGVKPVEGATSVLQKRFSDRDVAQTLDLCAGSVMTLINSLLRYYE